MSVVLFYKEYAWWSYSSFSCVRYRAGFGLSAFGACVWLALCWVDYVEGESSTLERRVDERTAELEALSARYRYDALTGLPNRTCLQQRLLALASEERPFATLYLDFDRFKAVNDSFGHAVGDDLLVPPR